MSNDGNRKPAFDRLPVHPGSVPESPSKVLRYHWLDAPDPDLPSLKANPSDDGNLVKYTDYAALAESHAELLKALPDLMSLFRLKWGNLDSDANAVYARVEQTIARAERVGGE